MKIKKGYTLSQFVDYLETELGLCVNEWTTIIKYNNFLKQPLKKEMFVNEIKKPVGSPPFEEGKDHHDYIKWHKAEKKVIFKGFEYQGCEDLYELYTNNKYYIEYNLFHEYFEFNDVIVKTIGDLFRETNGKLEIKNITLNYDTAINNTRNTINSSYMASILGK